MKSSTRLLRKGALIPETRVVLQRWEPDLSASANVAEALRTNPFGVRSEKWLYELRTTISSRLNALDPRLIPGLVALAGSEAHADTWDAVMHWVCVRSDSLYHAFTTDWLFDQYSGGVHALRTDDVVPFVRMQYTQPGDMSSTLSEYGILRAARDLLRMATDFSILTGNIRKNFVSYHLSEHGFLYLLHAMTDIEPNVARMIASADWHAFLMDRSDVERELLRLHQYRRVHFDLAGSLVQLKLPCASAVDFARGAN